MYSACTEFEIISVTFLYIAIINSFSIVWGCLESVEWNDGMECWNGMLEWNGGIEQL